MNEMLKLGAVLSGIYIVAAVALSAVNGVTLPVINERNIQANNESRQMVLEEAKEFTLVEKLNNDIVSEVYEGKSSSEIVGYTIKTTPKGYGGEVEVMVGISKEGKITGINIGKHSETPGLGTKAGEPDFKNQFLGKDVSSELNVVKGKVNNDNDIAAISGATITSTAVTSGVNAAISIFNENLANK